MLHPELGGVPFRLLITAILKKVLAVSAGLFVLFAQRDFDIIFISFISPTLVSTNRER